MKLRPSPLQKARQTLNAWHASSSSAKRKLLIFYPFVPAQEQFTCTRKLQSEQELLWGLKNPDVEFPPPLIIPGFTTQIAFQPM